VLCVARRTPSEQTVYVAGYFARWLRSQREQRGLTQEQLAYTAGLSRNQIQNLENNRNNDRTKPSSANPGLDTLLSLERAFGMEVGELLLSVREFMKEHEGSKEQEGS